MLTINFQRIYYFLFFNVCYSFLVFWITVSYFYKINGFLIGGIFAYFLVILFHRAIVNISNANPTPAFDDKKIKLFFVISIIFCAIGVLGVVLLKEIMISKLNMPREIFQNIDWILEAVSLTISFLLSFINKDLTKINGNKRNYK